MIPASDPPTDDRVSEGFASLRRAFETPAKHVSPFFVLGDPTPSLSFEIAVAAVRGGASMLELGIPFSDPSADGPAIQNADNRALAAGMTTARAMALMARIHEACPKTPLNLLVYGNLVHAWGYARFCEEAQRAGAASLLVPDIPLEECGALREACASAGLGFVALVGPLTSIERLHAIESRANAFLYLVGRQGVTGLASSTFDGTEALVRRVASEAHLPICLGFGLSRPDEVQRAFAAGARVAVIGSLFAKVIGAAWDPARGQACGPDVLASFSAAFAPFGAIAGKP